MRLKKAAKLQYNTKIGDCSMLEKSLSDDDEVIYIAKNKGLSKFKSKYYFTINIV